MAERKGTADVIHDIGFRHYDGPRLGRGWIVRSLLLETLRGVFGLGRPARVKTMPWVLVGILTAPALIMATVVILLHQDTLPLSYTQYPLGMWLIVAMFVAGRAPYAVSRDLRDGVMPLYLSRPLKQSDYVFAKFAGLSLGVFLFVALPETVLLIGALLAKLPMVDNILGWLGGLLMAAILAILLSALSLVLAAFTTKRGLGVAAIMTTLILANGMSNILTQVMRQTGYPGLGRYFRGLDPFGLIDELGHSYLGVARLDNGGGPRHAGGGFIYIEPPRLIIGVVFTVILVGFVGGCIGILLRRYRKVGGL